MKKIIYILMSLMLILTIASCESTEVTPELVESKTMTLYVGETGQFAEGYSYSTLNSDVLELNGNSYQTKKEGSAVVTVKQGKFVVGVYVVAVYGSEPIKLQELNVSNKPATMTVADKVKLDYTKNPVNANDYEDKSVMEISEGLASVFSEISKSRHSEIPAEHLNDIKRRVALSIVDRHWTQHIDAMQKLRDGVNYMSYAQIDPLNAYITQGYDKFQDMADHIALEVSLYTLNMKIERVESQV